MTGGVRRDINYAAARETYQNAKKFGSPWGDAVTHTQPLAHTYACRHIYMIGRIGVNELNAYVHTHMHSYNIHARHHQHADMHTSLGELGLMN
jgi:hypothetical protein